MELSTAGRRSICLPTRSQADYGTRMKDRRAFRIYLDEMIATYSELFPATIGDGYWLYGVVRSKKLDLSTRRIKLKATEDVYQLRPDFVMPYMSGKTDEVEKGLYLRRFGVPFEALACVFGSDASYWYLPIAHRRGMLSILAHQQSGLHQPKPFLEPLVWLM